MKAVMYHYVRRARPDLPRFRYLDADDFGRQLDHLVEHGGIVGRDALLEAVATGVPAPGHVLTFDDGLRDHAEVVTPMLVDRGLFGIFYASTGPLSGGAVLDVHRVHLLLGRLGPDRLLAEVEARVEPDVVDGDPSRWRDRYAHQGDDPGTTAKRLLNYVITPDARRRVLDDLVDSVWGGPLDPADVYASADQLRAMHDAGMLVGSHSESHQVMSRLSPEDQAAEVDRSFAVLDEATGGLEVRTWCHPYGGDATFDDHTVAALDAAGCRFGFSVEPRDIAPEDLRERRHALPRYDCNRFPHGRASGG